MKFQQLARALQERYELDAREIEPGHLAFEINTGERRSQVVHLLLKETQRSGTDASRIIAHSPIGPLPHRPDLEAFLRRNATLDVGAICIEDFRDADRNLITFLTLRASHLFSTADVSEMWEMIEKVAHVADALEKEIYAHDLR